MAELSNLQIELLRLYSNGVSDESLKEVKSILSKYFAKRATDEMDNFLIENGLTEQSMIEWANEHDRSANRSRH